VIRTTSSYCRWCPIQKFAMSRKLRPKLKSWPACSRRNSRVSSPADAASETDSMRGRTSSVIAIATTASTNALKRSVVKDGVPVRSATAPE